jgi:hypothetical protein
LEVELLDELIERLEEVLLQGRFDGGSDSLDDGSRFGTGEFGQVFKVLLNPFDKF